MSDTLYSLEGLEHRYNGQPVLWIPELSVERGSIVGLVGPNGSGKSTLLRILAFVESPWRGTVLFGGRRIDAASSAARFHVTLLTQEPYLLRRTVHANVSYGLRVRDDDRDRDERVREALDWVGLRASDFARRQWYQLSGGEAQRVALAARLILKPKVLLMDEPTASVDAASARLIRNAALRARHDWGATLIIASHDWSWLHEVCDEVLHLFKGRCIGSGMENLVHGPWVRDGSGSFEKRLGNGQRILVPEPASEDAVAVISPDQVSVSPREPQNGSPVNLLKGVLARLSLERGTGDILATIAVDELTLTARLKSSRLREASIYPGQKVWAFFDPESIKWF